MKFSVMLKTKKCLNAQQLETLKLYTADSPVKSVPHKKEFGESYFLSFSNYQDANTFVYAVMADEDLRDNYSAIVIAT